MVEAGASSMPGERRCAKARERCREMVLTKRRFNKELLLLLPFVLVPGAFIAFVLYNLTGQPSYESKFPFQEGEHRLVLNVRKHCMYGIGIDFRSTVRMVNVMGNARNIRLPAEVRIVVRKPSGSMVAPEIKIEGRPAGSYGSGTEIFMVGGYAYLEPGIYIANVRVANKTADFSGIDARLRVSGRPKSTCSKR